MGALVAEESSPLTKESDLESLYAPVCVGVRSAPNRWVAQPMEANDGLVGVGAPSARTIARYTQLARGGWGVVFVEATAVSSQSVGRLSGLVLNETTSQAFEELIRSFRALNPAALFLIQLTHSGRQTHPSLGPVAVCPNPEPGLRYLSSSEIEEIQRQFVRTALLAEQVGFDGIDYKLCNGYLGNELLRPANTRSDHWGGSLGNRFRFASEGLAEIAAQRKNPRFLLGARISFHENRAGGFGTSGPGSDRYDAREPLALVRTLGGLGLDYVNITGASKVPQEAPANDDDERHVASLCYERLTCELVQTDRLPLAVMGGGYSAFGASGPAIAARRLRAGIADLAGFGRQSLADPLTPRKLDSGDPVDWCTGCGACMRLILSERPGGCAQYSAQA